jgi:ribosomal protein L21E
VGTKLQIFSASLGGWQQDGSVVDVKNDNLTITYGSSKNQMKKTLNRYQDDLVKSLPEFINNRKEWMKDSKVEVYSHGQRLWCSGTIQEVLPSNEFQNVDIFRVFYTNTDNKDFSKYVPRWSPDLRPEPALSTKMRKYKRGTAVQVWSVSKKSWLDGKVIEIVPNHEVVNVRYGDHEKLVPIGSQHIKLKAVDEEKDGNGNHNQSSQSNNNNHNNNKDNEDGDEP